MQSHSAPGTREPGLTATAVLPKHFLIRCLLPSPVDNAVVYILRVSFLFCFFSVDLIPLSTFLRVGVFLGTFFQKCFNLGYSSLQIDFYGGEAFWVYNRILTLY